MPLEDRTAAQLVNALQHPIVTVGRDGRIRSANPAAEQFFQAGANVLTRHPLDWFLPGDSPLIALIRHVQSGGAVVAEHRVSVDLPRVERRVLVDIHVMPLRDGDDLVAVMLMPRSVTEAIDRQLSHRGAARTVSNLAAMLAHEIKNPLAGIRGAAQLLETSVGEDDRTLTRLICDESDRIAGLVNRMELFGDERPLERTAVNIHVVFERVKTIAAGGFARGIRIVEEYDPSLPPVLANQDLLVRAFLNLVKNAAEAIEDPSRGEITLRTSYRPGIRITAPGSRRKVSLPLEFSVIDNGRGIPDEILPVIFDPFVTTKSNGTGLGLALVAKIVGDHGGTVECKSEGRRTLFKILLPAFDGQAPDPEVGPDEVPA